MTIMVTTNLHTFNVSRGGFFGGTGGFFLSVMVCGEVTCPALGGNASLF
jgi:hypothetical protein